MINLRNTSAQKASLFNALIEECQCSSYSFSFQLSSSLKRKISELSLKERKALVNQSSELETTPLVLASKNGNYEIVEYLLQKCEADTEFKGRFEFGNETNNNNTNSIWVTPLWSAAVMGQLTVVVILLRHGADVNGSSDSGSTPLRSVCYMITNGSRSKIHFDIIKILLKAGANVQKPNIFGGTCLINSIQSTELLQFLLTYGEKEIDVNSVDNEGKSALYYAVQENRVEAVKVLLSHGANPFLTSRYGDDILRMACLKGSVRIHHLLLEEFFIEFSRVIESFELIGSTLLLDFHDVSSALVFWSRALELRIHHNCPKKLLPHPIFPHSEIDSVDEYKALSHDIQKMKLQGLLMTERILPLGHKDVIFRFMIVGASYADENKYTDALRLWNYVLELQIRKDTLLAPETNLTLRAILQLLINLAQRHEDSYKSDLDFKSIYTTAKLLVFNLLSTLHYLAQTPSLKAQTDNFDIILSFLCVLLHILCLLSVNDEEYIKCLYELIKEILALGSLRTSEGNSLLHLSVSCNSVFSSFNFLDSGFSSIFPSLPLTEFLLFCGFDVSLKNNFGETPLHIVSQSQNMSEKILTSLLQHGAHLELKDNTKRSSLHYLQLGGRLQSCHISFMPFLSLKCLSALRVKEVFSVYKQHTVPLSLVSFIDMH